MESELISQMTHQEEIPQLQEKLDEMHQSPWRHHRVVGFELTMSATKGLDSLKKMQTGFGSTMNCDHVDK